MTTTLLHGDCLSILPTLPAGSVQCIVTSPPYYGLRKYSDDPREIGQEPAPDCLAWARKEPPCGACFVCAMRAVFRELWRVLRADGTCWLNLGDSYSQDSTYQATRTMHTGAGWKQAGANRDFRLNAKNTGVPAKNLLMIPARVALALQSDGWIVRSDIVWSKPNCMPESVTDRPTRAHEYVFLLAKSARYYYDAQAISESAIQPAGVAALTGQIKRGELQDLSASKLGANQGPATRNKRTVWRAPDPDSDRAAFGLYLANLFKRLTESGVDSATIGAAMRAAEQDNAAAYGEKGTVWQISTQPFSGAHFATMPEALIAPCILAGSSAQACETCGAAWGRVVERDKTGDGKIVPSDSAAWHARRNGQNRALTDDPVKTSGLHSQYFTHTTRDLGFAPRCRCAANTGAGRSIVLDPFGGSGTVAKVAERYQRDSILIDLSYQELQEQRTDGVQVELFV